MVPAEHLWAIHSTAGLREKWLLISEKVPQRFWEVYDYSTRSLHCIFTVNCDTSYMVVYFKCRKTLRQIIPLRSTTAAVYISWKQYACDAAILYFIINAVDIKDTCINNTNIRIHQQK